VRFGDLPNDHGARATPKNVSRVRHDRFPHPGPLPNAEEIPLASTKADRSNVYVYVLVLVLVLDLTPNEGTFW
jgi:hypothetical protein